MFLLRNFQDLLRQRLGSRYDDLKPKSQENAMNAFEMNIKFTLNPYAQNCPSSVEIPVRGLPNDPSIGLDDGYLPVSKYVQLLNTS